MSKLHFQLFNTMHGETVAIIEMDGELLKAEAGIVDPETATLRPIKNGGIYTLLPMDDHTIAVLRAVRNSYTTLVGTPSKLLSDYMARLDDLVTTVKLLFDEIEYTLVENAADMDKLINPPKGDYTPKTVKYDILGALQKLICEGACQE